MTHYAKGCSFEYKARNKLQAAGYLVVRSAGSKGPADLVALRQGEVLLVQAKKNGRLSKREEAELVVIANKYGACPVLCGPGLRFERLRDGQRLELDPAPADEMK